MKRLQKAAILSELAARLQAYGSWCGETHLQKSTYFLQELLGVPLGLEYILYKHGPFSFDLMEELTSMRADYLLDKEYKASGYPPKLVPTKTSAELRRRFPVTLGKYARDIDFIAQRLGTKGVVELEKLATALYVTRELAEGLNATQRAGRLHALKPHVSPADALAAIEEFDRIDDAVKARTREVNHDQ